MSETPILGHPLPTLPDAPITSGFSPARVHPVDGVVRAHNGIDYGAPAGTPVGAIADGEVMFAGDRGAAGNVVIVRHGDADRGFSYSAVFHLQNGSTVVQPGDKVVQGQTLAGVGTTGTSTGPHAHLEYFEGGDEAFIRQGMIGTSGARRLDPALYVGQPFLDRITIREGDENAAVERLQERLVERGLLPPGSADGDFGPNTRRAVEALQREQGLEVDGIVGRDTRGALGQAPTTPSETPRPTPAEPAPEPGAGGGAGGGGAAVLNTEGPFAGVSVGDLVGVRGGTPLGALTADQSYALARAVFGDGPGAAALEALDRAYGPGDGTLVRREVALALHEGRLHVGIENADPESGYNNGTFQIGGRGSTEAETRQRYNTLVGDGIALYERLSGESVDRDALLQGDRDVFAHIGHIQEKGRISATSTPDHHFERLADPSLQGDALARFMSREVQVGIPAIGEAVVAYTDPQSGVGIGTAAVAARGREPDETRAEPAFPVLDPRFAPDYSPAVEEWQRTLAAAGYDTGAPDGDFGPITRAATERAQRDAGLPDDGVVGPDTWRAYAPARAETIGAEAPTPDPVPPVAAPVTEPAAAALGSAVPEDYSVRQFTETVAVGAWDPAAARVGLSGDDARWVADTETPGSPGVQLTFPGTIDPAGATLTAPPGSRVAAVLDAAGDGLHIRQSVQDGSPGTYVVVPREAILAAGYESADAFVAEARGGQIALQEGAPVQRADLQASGDGASAGTTPVLSSLGRAADALADGALALYLRSLDQGMVTLVGQYTSGPEAAVGAVAALNATSHEMGAMTPDQIRETVRSVDPESKEVPALAAGALALALGARAAHAARDPEAAVAVDAAAGRPDPGGDGAARDVAPTVPRLAGTEPATPTL